MKPSGSFALGLLARQAVLAATLALVVLPAPVTAQESEPGAEMAEARAIMKIMFPPEEREATMQRLMTDISDQFAASVDMDSYTDPGLRSIMEGYLAGLPAQLMPLVSQHLPRMMEATAVAYTREFTLEELKDIHAFAMTPSGARYLSRSAALVGDPAVAEVNTQYFRELQALNQGLVAQLRQDIVAYLEAHPEVLESMQNSAQ